MEREIMFKQFDKIDVNKTLFVIGAIEQVETHMATIQQLDAEGYEIDISNIIYDKMKSLHNDLNTLLEAIEKDTEEMLEFNNNDMVMAVSLATYCMDDLLLCVEEAYGKLPEM